MKCLLSAYRLASVGLVAHFCLVLTANLIDYGCHAGYKTGTTKVTGHAWPQHAMGLKPSPNVQYYTDKEKQYVSIKSTLANTQ